MVCTYIRTIKYLLHLTSFMMLEVGNGEANLNSNERKRKALSQWYGNSNTSCIYPVQQLLPQVNAHACMRVNVYMYLRVCTCTYTIYIYVHYYNNSIHNLPHIHNYVFFTPSMYVYMIKQAMHTYFQCCVMLTS